MIGVKTADGVEYITKFEHFRGLMPDETYEALEKYIEKLIEDNAEHISFLQEKIEEAKEETSDEEVKLARLQWIYAGLCDDFIFVRDALKIFLKNEPEIGIELKKVLEREV